MRCRKLAVLLCGMPLVSSTAFAQSRQLVSVQASGLLTSLYGNAFDLLRIGTGLGAEFQLRLNPGALSVGAGFQISDHSSTGQGLTNKVTITGFFLEPRYAIAIDSRTVRPYFAARIGLLRQTSDLQDIATTFKVKADAIAYGGGGGFVARLNNYVNFDLGVAVTSANFGTFMYRDTGSDSGLDAGHGLIFVVKTGFNVGLGSP